MSMSKIKLYSSNPIFLLKAVDNSTLADKNIVNLTVDEQVNLLIRRAYAEKNGINLTPSTAAPPLDLTEEDAADFELEVKYLQ